MDDLMQWWLCHLPEAAKGVEPERPEGTDLVIWQFAIADALFAYGFCGKSRKPAWTYRFRSAAQRAEFVAEKTADRRAHFARKAKQAAERKSATHNLVVGDILSSSWGYDQTNVDFYEVVEVKSAKSIVICQIGKVAVANEKVMPVPGTFEGAPMLKRVSPHGSVKIEDFAHASKWSGQPKYETDIRAGH